MPGNSQRRGAVRKSDKKGPQVGSGGQRRRSLEGKGPTPKAADRPNHKAHKFAKAADKANAGRPGGARGAGRRDKPSSEVVAGRIPPSAAGRPPALAIVAMSASPNSRSCCAHSAPGSARSSP